MGKFRLTLTELSARDMPIFSFPDDTLSKYQEIVTNLVHALILRRSSLGLLMGIFCQILTELSARDTPKVSFPDNNFSKYQRILTKLGTCIDIKEIWFGIANGRISSIIDRVIRPQHDNGGYCRFTFYLGMVLLNYHDKRRSLIDFL